MLILLHVTLFQLRFSHVKNLNLRMVVVFILLLLLMFKVAIQHRVSKSEKAVFLDEEVINMLVN